MTKRGSGKGSGWYGNSQGHSLASRGVRTKSGTPWDEAIGDEREGVKMYAGLKEEFPEHKEVLERIREDEEFHVKLLTMLRKGERVNRKDLVRLDGERVIRNAVRGGEITKEQGKYVRGRLDKYLNNKNNSQLWMSNGLGLVLVSSMIGAVGSKAGSKIMDKFDI